mgnify:CR=1 FL=1
MNKSKIHLAHPTQATACGTHAQAGIPAQAFDQTKLDRCRLCERVRLEQLAVQPHLSLLKETPK